MGGAKGIGEAIVLKLMQDDWSVDLTYNHTEHDLHKLSKAGNDGDSCGVRLSAVVSKPRRVLRP